jgi:transposase
VGSGVDQVAGAKPNAKRSGEDAENRSLRVLLRHAEMPSASLPWRDLPREREPWRTICMRFKRWSENGLLWKILYELKQKKLVRMDIVFMDSTTARRIGADVGSGINQTAGKFAL